MNEEEECTYPDCEECDDEECWYPQHNEDNEENE